MGRAAAILTFAIDRAAAALDRPRSLSWPLWAVAVVTLVRVLEEAALYPHLVTGPSLPLFIVEHAGFYLLSFVCFAVALAALTRRPLEHTFGLVALGLFVGILPPVFDALLTGRPADFYTFFYAFTWAFTAEKQPLGETLALWLAALLPVPVVALATRSLVRGALAGVVGWALIQFVSWGLHAILLVPLKGDRSPLYMELYSFAHVAVAALVWIGATWRRSRASTLRFVHALPWGLVAASGAAFAGNDLAAAAGRGLLMSALFQIVVFHNDWYDREDDARGGRGCTLAPDDLRAWWAFAGALLATVAVFRPHWLALALLFFALWSSYHLPGLRLKRFPAAGYAVEGAGAAICFLLGAAQNGEALPADAEALAAGLLAGAGGFVISIPKDWKDLAADRASSIRTLYALLVDRGWPERRVHLGVVVVVGASLLVPVPLLLLIGAPAAGAAALAVLAVAAAAAALVPRDPGLATRAWLWVLNGYLLALALTLGTR